MHINIALAGNPNSGKTTIFNELTGSSQYVGNWPGVTVERKEGKVQDPNHQVVVQDLPGIYSLSPYSLEEKIARDYLINQSPDVILNIVDASNIERSLYLTTQFLELDIPVVVALNMMDLVKKQGDTINKDLLSQMLGCPVVELSAIKKRGVKEAAQVALASALSSKGLPANTFPAPIFSIKTETLLTDIRLALTTANNSAEDTPHLRWLSTRFFQGEHGAQSHYGISTSALATIEEKVSLLEKSLDDDRESILIKERYDYIESIVEKALIRGRSAFSLSFSDKLDSVLTNRLLAIPIFMLVMFVVYYISITSLGAIATDFTNDTIFAEWIIPSASAFFNSLNVAPWLTSLVVDGVIGGVGAVLGFVPQMLILFLLLSLLEDCGYMSRVAFIMDRIFRQFGLSGKSFIPMLIGSGCSVPGIMASRTIEHERDRKMTIITTSFIPCGAKMPIVALIAGAFFGGAWWVAPSAYFIGILAVIMSGLILKRLKFFSGNNAPFVMELPAYHGPVPMNILRTTWERGWSFIRRAGTIILLASIVIWFLSSFGIVAGKITMVENMNISILAGIGNFIAPVFSPLGFGNWQASVATIMGLVAKEEVVGVFGVLYGVSGNALDMVDAGTFSGLAPITSHFTPLAAFSFLIFNLLCAPCFAAIGAIKREMNSGKWTFFAVGYLTAFAYIFAFVVYQIGMLFAGTVNIASFVVIAVLVAVIVIVVKSMTSDGKNPLTTCSSCDGCSGCPSGDNRKG